MLNYKTITAKKTINVVRDNENIEMLDLLTKSTETNVNVLKNGDFQYIIVTKEYVARPDLIGLAIYGDDRYGDVICKVNGISNPFELNENMHIICPSPTIADTLLKSTANDSDILQYGESSVIEKKKTGADDSKTTLLTTAATVSKETSSVKKKTDERRSPGEQTVNDINYVIDKSLGIVIY